MYSRTVLVSLVGGILVGVALHGASTRISAQQATVEAPKWDLGDHWTWQRGNGEITATVVGTSGGYAVQVKSGTGTSMVHYTFDLSSTDTPFINYQFPLSVAKEWTYTLEGTYAGSPAIAFDTVRVSGHHCNITRGYCGDFVTWYAPKAKQAVRTTWTSSKYWPVDLNGLNQVLVSYELHNP